MALGEINAGFSGFKGRMLLFAGVLVLGGMTWNGASGFYKSGGLPIRSGASAGAQDWKSGPSALSGVFGKGDKVSGPLIGIGLSFMIAMIAASVLRAAFKTGLSILVIAGVALWFLDSRGYVDWWDGYVATAKAGSGWLTGHFAALREMMLTHLPSATAALIGFGFGLRR